MTVKELRDQLDRLIRLRPEVAYATINFGPDRSEVRGGQLFDTASRGPVLHLAPLSLDRVGGF